MDAGINNIIYMELHSGPKMANGTCGKMITAGTIDRGSTVLPEVVILILHNFQHTLTTIRIRVDQLIGEEPKPTRDNFAKYNTAEPTSEVLI
jgi:hypothetical protein